MLPDNIFLTGIECSDPFVKGERRNLLIEAHNFYQNFEKRLENIKAIGINFVRIGIPYSQSHIGENKFDFFFMDRVVQKCKELNIHILTDFVHFGLPEWLHEQNPSEPFFQNPLFPEKFLQYIREFVRRYKEIKIFGLINEPFITANFSAKLGFWNESIESEDDRAFVRAVKNIAYASILAKKEIERIFLDEKREFEPVFVQTESFEFAKSGKPQEVKKFNLRRFAPLDLILGHMDENMKKYLLSEGLQEQEYDWFMNNASRKNMILGIDHYPTCVHILSTRKICSPTDPYYLRYIVKVYWNRYGIPLLHTEVNALPIFAEKLCLKTFRVISQLRKEGFPVLGMSWYGDEYQVDWHYALRYKKNEETKVGLYYKGKLQSVGKLFAKLIKKKLPEIKRPLVPGPGEI
jgi:beta-glucosidase